MIERAIAILNTVLALTSMSREPEEFRGARLWPTMVELAQQCQNTREASFAITQGLFESRFDRDVGWLICNSNQCDPEHSIGFRARGFWQNHRIETVPEWAKLWDSLQGQATPRENVALQLAMQRANACGGNMVEAFCAMDGSGCRECERGKNREQARKRVHSRLLREMAR